jgi:hypothetical protein
MGFEIAGKQRYISLARYKGKDKNKALPPLEAEGFTNSG